MREVGWSSAPLVRRTGMALFVIAASAVGPGPGSAQQPAAPAAALATGLVAGVVHDEAGNEIASVEVTVVGTPIRVLSDVQGAFLLRRVPVGTATLRLRRLGFAPRSLEVAVDTTFAPPLEVELSTLPMRLATVKVLANRRVYSGYMADFYRRRDTNIGGQFFTRAQIDSLRPYRTTDLLRRVPGLNFSQSARGGETIVRTRGQRCAPLVYLDGAPTSAAYFDPDHVDPRSIEGIEIYSGLGTTPSAFTTSMISNACGVVAIWTRIPEPRGKESGKRKGNTKETATRLAALVDSLQVYTVAQVDEAVSLDTLVRFAPQFPAELRQSKQPGLVVAEFVVDVEGHVEPTTFGVVTSTHPLFSAAVDSALAGAVFHPATRAGRRVRQLVQLPVYFTLPTQGSN